MESQLQVEDLDQALLVISFKNDQINSLKTSIKASEKKTSLRLADLQFKLDQEKSKSVELQRKGLKNQQSSFKLKEQYEQKLRKLQNDNKKLVQSINEMHSQERRKEREFKATIYQQKLKFEREKEHSHKLSSQLDNIHQYFDPSKILKVLNKQSFEELPNYLQIYRKYEEKVEEVKQLSLKMSKLESETILNIEQSFKKLSSYQAVMESLNSKNIQLQESMKIKQQQIQLHSLQIVEKELLIQTVKQIASQQLQNLNDQILTLRSFVNKEDANQEDQVYNESHINYQQTINQLEQIIQEKENEMQQMQGYFYEQINVLSQANQFLKKQLQIMQITILNQREHYQQLIISIKQVIGPKDNQILQLTATIQQQKEIFSEKKQQLEKYIIDLTDYLKKKKKLQEEHRQIQAAYKERIQNLENELKYIKMQLYNHDQEQSVNQYRQNQQFDVRSLQRAKSGVTSLVSIKQHRNLFADIRDNSIQDETSSKLDIGRYEQQPNWSELYYNLLLKHNAFAKKVQARLQLIKR